MLIAKTGMRLILASVILSFLFPLFLTSVIPTTPVCESDWWRLSGIVKRIRIDPSYVFRMVPTKNINVPTQDELDNDHTYYVYGPKFMMVWLADTIDRLVSGPPIPRPWYGPDPDFGSEFQNGLAYVHVACLAVISLCIFWLAIAAGASWLGAWLLGVVFLSSAGAFSFIFQNWNTALIGAALAFAGLTLVSLFPTWWVSLFAAVIVACTFGFCSSAGLTVVLSLVLVWLWRRQDGDKYGTAAIFFTVGIAASILFIEILFRAHGGSFLSASIRHIYENVNSNQTFGRFPIFPGVPAVYLALFFPGSLMLVVAVFCRKDLIRLVARPELALVALWSLFFLLPVVPLGRVMFGILPFLYMFLGRTVPALPWSKALLSTAIVINAVVAQLLVPAETICKYEMDRQLLFELKQIYGP